MINVKFNHTIDVQLTDDQKDCLIIQLLQEMHQDAKEDYERATSNPDNIIYSHPEDVKNAKRRAKAAKRLLEYHMIPSDFEEFLASIEHGYTYSFKPEQYMDR